VVSAQETGTVSGRVTEAGSNEGVARARIEVLSMPGRRIVATATTSDDGRFNVPRLAAGSYALRVMRLGYTLHNSDAVVVASGQVARVDVAMASSAAVLDPVGVTSERRPEKVNTSPTSIAIVNERQIRERPTVSVVEHTRDLPGVHATQGGLMQTNVVTRGFNNAFSGSLLMLQDNRFANVPSLRVNIPSLMSSTNEDIDRIEVVLGPGAALYGPNASNGVMHVITKSPFDSKGTILTLDGGERSLMRLGGRHANTIGNRVGFKVSGEYMRGNEWEYEDPAEPTNFPSTVVTPQSRRNQPNNRNFDVERFGGEARVDVKVGESSDLILTYGGARIGSGLELTGANGTAQISDWRTQHLQTRFRSGNFFAQAFGNMSHAGNETGDDTRGTYLLRTGQPIVDYSRLGALQVQQGIDIGTRQTFLVGGDYVFTNPRTGGTIHGRNDEDDNTTEYGGYVHSVTRLSPRFAVTTALRADRNSRLDETFVSPRAALVFTPTPLQNFRVSYNRAFSTPGSFQMFLDLLQGTLSPTVPYDVRALGVPSNGFNFRRDCTGGLNNLCMRSPFPYANGSAGLQAAFTPAVGFQNALAAALGGGLQPQLQAGLQASGLSQQQAAGLAAAAVARLRTLNPTSTQVGTNLRLFNPSLPAAQVFSTPYSADSVADIAPLKASFVNNYEVGYKGVVGAKLRVAIDGWYQRRENFVTAASNFTPTVFLGGTQTGAYIGPELVAAFQAAGLSAAQAQALAAGLTPTIAGALARVPAGTVVPDSRLTTNGDIAFTYRNLDRSINLYGSDVGVDYLFTQRFSMAATYSWVSDVEFPDVQNGGDILRLNSPDHKASLTSRWADDIRGYSFEARGRYMNAFRVNSAVFIGHVPVNAFLDASASWRLPVADRRLTWGINATNVLNNKRASFVGVPEIGRLVMTRVQYSF
jgi:iron complex outermembrane receptor protein